MDFLYFGLFLVLNFNSTVLDAQKELSVQIWLAEGSIFKVLRNLIKNMKIHVRFPQFWSLSDPKLQLDVLDAQKELDVQIWFAGRSIFKASSKIHVDSLNLVLSARYCLQSL